MNILREIAVKLAHFSQKECSVSGLQLACSLVVRKAIGLFEKKGVDPKDITLDHYITAVI